MKEIEFPLDSMSTTLFFEPIRCKKDVILILMKSIKHMLISNKFELRNTDSKMVLRVSKMSRLLFYSEHKQFSISFPFNVKILDDSLEIYSAEGVNIDNKLTSEIIEILSILNLFEFRNIYTILEVFDELELPSEGLYTVFMNLLYSEDGYIRYDFDAEREDATLHPLNHLDIFYDNSNTFKIGLNKRLQSTELLDIIDITTRCYCIS